MITLCGNIFRAPGHIAITVRQGS